MTRGSAGRSRCGGRTSNVSTPSITEEVPESGSGLGAKRGMILGVEPTESSGGSSTAKWRSPRLAGAGHATRLFAVAASADVGVHSAAGG